MTNDEAIKILKGAIKKPNTEDGYMGQALTMAIKALEQQTCGDAVNRAHVMLIVREFLNNSTYDEEMLVNDLNKLHSVQPEQKWIPVSERLPEESTAVLIWCPERKNIYCAYLEKKQWWIFGAYFQKVTLEVIAWMPLPKKYEPQESEVQDANSD